MRTELHMQAIKESTPRPEAEAEESGAVPVCARTPQATPGAEGHHSSC